MPANTDMEGTQDIIWPNKLCCAINPFVSTFIVLMRIFVKKKKYFKEYSIALLVISSVMLFHGARTTGTCNHTLGMTL